MPNVHLTDLSVRAIKGSDKYVTYWDDATPGFGIRVGKRSKTWTVMRGRARERVTIGRYPDVSLSEARTEAKRLLSTAPAAKHTSKTWAQARDEFQIENYKDSRSSWPGIVKLFFAKHLKELDHRQLADITDSDIKRVLDKLAATPSTQLHTYRVSRTFLKWCTRPPRRYLLRSPMEGYEPPGKDRKGTRTLTDDELIAVWKAAGSLSRPVLRLLVLWGLRNGEACALSRNWVKDGVLTIPGGNTKNGRDHGIPILPLAQSILDDRLEISEYYFRGRYSNETHLTPGSLNRMLREVQEETGTKDWTLRDIRRTFRSNMARLKVPREVCEVLINHAPPVLDEIYDRYDRLEEKREALAKHEAFVLQLLSRG